MSSSRKNRNTQGSAGDVGIAAGGPAAPRALRFLAPLVVMGLTFLVFLPALRNGFVNWDDDKILLENEHFRGFGQPQLHWMATAYWIGHYHPLTWLSFAVDYRLWGLDEKGAFGFHLTNVIFHCLNAGLFYMLAARLLSPAAPSRRGSSNAVIYFAAALAALFFAIHPLRVESVAWVTERRDVLSVFFLLSCLLSYVAYATASRRQWGFYAAAIVLLLLSLLCKAWGMTTPVVLLILDWYPLGRFRGQSPGGRQVDVLPLLLEKLPFAALAMWAAHHAVQAQSSALYTMKGLAEYGWLPRIAQGAYGIAFYLWKTLWPTGLIPIYEVPARLNPFEGRFIGAACLVVVMSAAMLALRRRWPAGLALWACYIVIVSPVLGLAQAGPQLVADRYSYVACMTWALLLGACGLKLIRSCSTARHGGAVLAIATTVATAVLVTLGTLTSRQVGIWRDSETLWRHTLALAPGSYYAHANLAAALAREGRTDAAEQQYRAALAVRPDGAEAMSNLGGLLSNSGRYAEALPYLQNGLRQNPNQATAATSLAITLQHLGRNEEAAAIYQEQLAGDVSPEQQARLYIGLGGALGSLGRLTEAADCFRRAAPLAPKDDLPMYNLGLALRQLGDLAGAIQAEEAAIRLAEDIVRADPKALPRTHMVDELVCAGEIHLAMGDIAAARQCLQRALQLDSRHAGALEALRRIDLPR